MKKIIHVSNFNMLRFKGCFMCGMPIKISNGLTRNGYYVMNYPDRDLCRMFGFGHMNFLGRKRLNRHLIDYCKATAPDALFIGHADSIELDTLREIKELFPELKILQWSCDWIVPSFAERNIQALKKYLDVVDVLMITTGDKQLLQQFNHGHTLVSYLPNMVDASIETGRAFELDTPDYDIILAANTGKRQFAGQDEELDAIVDEANRRIPDLKWLLAGLKGTSPLNGYDYIAKLSRTGMGLNLSRLNNIYHYSSDRMVHIMGNGGLAFIDRRTGFNDVFSEEEAAFYTEREEFFDKLKYFKTHSSMRRQVAYNGYKKLHRDFNEQVITRQMADLLFNHN